MKKLVSVLILALFIYMCINTTFAFVDPPPKDGIYVVVDDFILVKEIQIYEVTDDTNTPAAAFNRWQVLTGEKPRAFNKSIVYYNPFDDNISNQEEQIFNYYLVIEKNNNEIFTSDITEFSSYEHISEIEYDAGENTFSECNVGWPELSGYKGPFYYIAGLIFLWCCSAALFWLKLTIGLILGIKPLDNVMFVSFLFGTSIKIISLFTVTLLPMNLLTILVLLIIMFGFFEYKLYKRKYKDLPLRKVLIFTIVVNIVALAVYIAGYYILLNLS